MKNSKLIFIKTMEENKKYKLTDETIIHQGKKLYRIEALKDFSGVRKGNLGGYVESEHNLSHNGDCWIANSALVFDGASVSGNACVCDYAIVCGTSSIEQNAIVYGHAFIRDSYVLDNSAVSDYAKLDNCVTVSEDSTIEGHVEIVNGIEIGNGTYLKGKCKIHHQDDFITLPLWWNGNKTITYVFNNDKWFTSKDEYSTDYLIEYGAGDHIQALIEMAQIASKFNGLIDIDSFLGKIEAKCAKKEILPDGKVSLLCDELNLQIILEFDKEHRYKENDIKALNDALKAIFSENDIAEIKCLPFIKNTEIKIGK